MLSWGARPTETTMHKLLTVLAAAGLLGAVALPIEASAAAKRETAVTKGEITDYGSRRYDRHYHRPHYHRHDYRPYYGYPYYYRPWGYPYYSYRPYWGGPADSYFGFGW